MAIETKDRKTNKTSKDKISDKPKKKHLEPKKKLSGIKKKPTESIKNITASESELQDFLSDNYITGTPEGPAGEVEMLYIMSQTSKNITPLVNITRSKLLETLSRDIDLFSSDIENKILQENLESNTSKNKIEIIE